MAVYRVKCRWSGFSGAPGYTILHFDAPTEPTVAGAQAVYDNAYAFIGGISSLLPSVVSITLENNVEVIDQTTNELTNVLSVVAKSAHVGTTTGGFSSATGACIIWETGEVRNGRRVRGRSFIVPMAGTHYDVDGTLKTTALTDLQDAAAVLTGGGFSFGVLARPTAVGAADGSFHTASSGRISDKTAVLRSRRD